MKQNQEDNMEQSVWYYFIGIRWLTTCISFLLLLIFLNRMSVDKPVMQNFICTLNVFLFVHEMILSYFQFIDWFFTCLDFFVCIIVGGIVLAVFTKTNVAVWLINVYYFISSQLIDSLLAYICILFITFELLLPVCYWLFDKKSWLFMIVK